MGLHLALLRDNKCRNPIFSVFFFLKGIMIVHEIKKKKKIMNARFFLIISYSKKANPICEELPKYLS